MKSKGFTLIELLAVIVILAIIALIATPIILNIIDDTKESSKERSKELYLDAAEQAIAAYNMKNPMVDLSNAECNIITKEDEENNVTVGDLSCTETKDSDPIYIKVEMDGEKPTDGKIIFNDGKVTVTEELVFGDSNLTSEVTLSSLCGEPISYTTEGELTVGDKYSCDFGTGARNFYILELGSNPVTGTKLESDEVALILEGNYDTTTQYWCDQEGDNPTNNACDADGLIGKREEIAEAWGLDIEQVVLPSAEQIMLADGRSENEYTNEPPLKNSWLYNWPDNSNYDGNNAPYGYWTSSPYVGNSDYAWFVYSRGSVSNDGVDIGVSYGVRPVVNLKF